MPMAIAGSYTKSGMSRSFMYTTTSTPHNNGASIGPENIYSATHPLDPAVRRGLEGLEAGKEIHIEDDVWIGGSVTILGGVRIGRGSTIGASAVVTRDIPSFHFAAGNPARVIRRIETSMDHEQREA